jgi:regulator of sirC expression with transglutaminase-like and TPR domain
MLFEEVLRLRPEEPQSYRDLALVLARQGQYERAIELLYKVTRAPPRGIGC